MTPYLDRTDAAEMLTDERIIEIRDELLPSQGESFDCIAFAHAILRARPASAEFAPLAWMLGDEEGATCLPEQAAEWREQGHVVSPLFDRPPPTAAWWTLYHAINLVIAPLGYHGTISARDDRVADLMDALHAIDEGVPFEQPAAHDHRSAVMNRYLDRADTGRGKALKPGPWRVEYLSVCVEGYAPGFYVARSRGDGTFEWMKSVSNTARRFATVDRAHAAIEKATPCD